MVNEFDFGKESLFHSIAGNEIAKAREERDTALRNMLTAMEAFTKAWEHETNVIEDYFGYDRDDLTETRKVGDFEFKSPIEVIEWIVMHNK